MMSSDAAITRAKERFEALRARDAVAIMYSESATELVPLSPTHLPRHFRKFEGMRAFKGRVDAMLSELNATGGGVSYFGMVDQVTLTRAHAEAGFW